ncbi:MAG TPA: sugar phosphate nucleotidyltransferase, partial [Dysgonamonadaceae bacterium]|nr:sugar phosphate nucleotidyltransferase [Dysgonamonadaceae bacterium]
MKAMILAAGLGTRLKPFTNSTPKALVPILGKPVIEHVILKLKKQGFNEVIINIHHFGDQIIDFIKSKNYFDIRIEFSDERDKLLDTGGAIKKASWFFDADESILIHNTDIISDVNLSAVYDNHIQNKAMATLVVNERK